MVFIKEFQEIILQATPAYVYSRKDIILCRFGFHQKFLLQGSNVQQANIVLKWRHEESFILFYS